MKKIILALLVLVCSHTLYSQIDNNSYSISMGGGFGRGWFGEEFSSMHIAPAARLQVDSNLAFRIGVLDGTTWISSKDPESKAPLRNRYRHNAAHIGVDYLINDKFFISVNAFVDMFNPAFNQLQTSQIYTYGINANMTYKISENSAINLSFTYMQSNNPYNYINSHLSPYTSPYLHNSFSPLMGGGFWGASPLGVMPYYW